MLRTTLVKMVRAGLAVTMTAWVLAACSCPKPCDPDTCGGGTAGTGGVGPGGVKGLITMNGQCASSTDCKWPKTHPLYDPNLNPPTCVDNRCRADLRAPGFQCLEGDTKPCATGSGTQLCDASGAWQGC